MNNNLSLKEWQSRAQKVLPGAGFGNFDPSISLKKGLGSRVWDEDNREYIDFLMTWVENQLNNEKIFPCALGVSFPKNFMGIIKVIFKRLFRVYAHIYHTHF